MQIKIYYLDDEPALCRLFQHFLNSDEIKVKTFIDANQAISEANKHPPDIFFIDYRLNGTTGDEVAASVPKDIYKVLVTGDLSLKPKFNFDQKITKPYSLQDIEVMLRERI